MRIRICLAHGFPKLMLKAHKTAGGHLFALLEEEHSEQLAAEITSALLLESEGEILHMLRARDVLDSQVAATVLVHRVKTLKVCMMSGLQNSVELPSQCVRAPRFLGHLLCHSTPGTFCR